MGGKFLPKLNISGRPIAHKYREGNVKRTLKRELKVFETVKEQAMKLVGGCDEFTSTIDFQTCTNVVFFHLLCNVCMSFELM
jgi:hypothetical protein